MWNSGDEFTAMTHEELQKARLQLEKSLAMYSENVDRNEVGGGAVFNAIEKLL